MTTKRVIIFSAPSGSGKSTIISQILGSYPSLRFSVSATSRAPRGQECDGVDYHFLSPEEFKRRIESDEFVEWEEVYSGTCYGTLKSEIQQIWDQNQVAIFDVDVVGGVNLKKIYGPQAVSIFIMPPSIEELQRRLIGRATDSPEAIEKRVAKATHEIAYAEQFDEIVVNDSLDRAVEQVTQIINSIL